MKRLFPARVPLAARAAPVILLLAGCQPSEQQLAARHIETIDQFCTDCHNDLEREGDTSLERVDLARVVENADLWEKVIVKLRGNLMPPPGRPRPPADVSGALVGYLETRLDEAAAANPDPGRAGLHRLNRTEYGNAVRDLLALEIDPAEFLPADDEAYGFDNIADVLRISPSLLEQYLSASSKVAALAVGDPTTRVTTSIHRAPPDLAQGDHVAGLPLGTRGGFSFQYNFPLDAEYELGVFLLRNIVGYMKGLEWPHQLEISIDGARVFLANVGGEADNAMSDANFSAAADAIDERLRVRVPVEAGPREVVVAFIRKSSAETHEPLELHTRDQDLQNMNGEPIVDYVSLSGPLDATGRGSTPSRERIFTCRPGADAEALPCAEEILATLARRAYRRPVTEADLGLLLEFFESGRAQGDFDAGIQNALRVMLANPAFLYRSEPDPPGVVAGALYPVDDLALASRLSFFLWSSVPDDELLRVAERRELADPAVYEAQVRRMLADPRARALVENFAGQWLFLRNLRSARPGIEDFPDFDENLRSAMLTETELFIESVVREDRSVIDLITADYTYLNERLARHYGVPGIYGSHFRRVDVPIEARRGLLGHGSILTVTSYPNRTSPVLRGKWVMENVLGTPPPVPPPNVPALDENEPGGVARSVRERLREHRGNPVCASCHDVLDPLGLALENFDAVGRWRLKEPGGDVDPSGQLADGTEVSGPIELRDALAARPEQFAGVIVEKLLTYALGRGLTPHDMPVVRGIVRQAESEGYRFSSLVLGVATSTPFRLKRAEADEAAEAEATAALAQPAVGG